jgi:hypothetical protein
MTDEQVLELHGDMLRWATELLVAAQPAIRRSYKNCEDNYAPKGVAKRFKDDRTPDELSNYQVWKELKEFLEVAGANDLE